MLALDSLISTQATIESSSVMFSRYKQMLIVKWKTRIERSSQSIPVTFVQFFRGNKALWAGKSAASEYQEGTKVWLRGKVSSCKGGMALPQQFSCILGHPAFSLFLFSGQKLLLCTTQAFWVESSRVVHYGGLRTSACSLVSHCELFVQAPISFFFFFL